MRGHRPTQFEIFAQPPGRINWNKSCRLVYLSVLNFFDPFMNPDDLRGLRDLLLLIDSSSLNFVLKHIVKIAI